MKILRYRLFLSLLVLFSGLRLLGQEPVADAPKSVEPPKVETTEAKPETAPEPPKETPKAETTPSAAPAEEASKAKSRTERTKRSEKATEAKPASKQVRLLELSGSYVDHMSPLSFNPSSLLLGGGGGKQKSFFKLCTYLDDLGSEEAVTHVVFDLSDDSLDLNSAQLDELTRHIKKLRGTGKKVFAWLENASNRQLAIAVACDQIAMADMGSVDMPSSSMETMFYRDAMDLLGVRASVVRAGDFKGAVEPYVNPVMSEHLRKHYMDMLSSMNDASVDRIAKGRGMTVAEVRSLQKRRVFTASDALAAKLVDHLGPYGSMKETLGALLPEKLEWTKPKAPPRREVSFFELMGQIMSGPKETKNGTKGDTIAVMHLSGEIVDGKNAAGGSIVSGPTVQAIEEITNDDNIKGVVLRINSPGGSATASEAIRRALEVLSKKKPVVVSMGEMAASGGYWVTCIGQPIYAERGTITGSIGVFSMKISAGTLTKRLGVHIESIALDESAKSDAIDRAWSDEDLANSQKIVDEIYEKFLKLVSQSRSIPIDHLRTLAGGRVWSGEQAKGHKLVDEIGGLDDCIAVVAKKANLEKFKIVHRPVVKEGLDLMELLGERSEEEISIPDFVKSGLLEVVKRKGFSMRSTATLLRAALNGSSGSNTVWAMTSEEFRIRD